MDWKLRVLFSVLFIFVSFGNSYPAISVHADSSGNIISSLPGPSEPAHRKNIYRHSVPEGTALLKNVEYEFYPVSGRTYSEIIRSIEENGPFNREGTKRLPYKCDWYLGVTYQFSAAYAVDEENSRVHVEFEIYEVSTEDRILISLPTLIDDTFLNPVEKNIWGQYLLRLVGQAHDTVKILRDINRSRKVTEGIRELSYVIFDYKEGMDVEKTIETYLRHESEKAVSGWARESGAKVAEYEKATAYGLKHEMSGPFFRDKD